MNQLMLSGTRPSCYRGRESSLRASFSARSSRSNCTNQKSFGFLLTKQTESARWRAATAVRLTSLPLLAVHALHRAKALGCQLLLRGAAA